MEKGHEELIKKAQGQPDIKDLMRVKVKFFSTHREAVGRNGIEIELKEKANINEMMNMLMNTYPELRKLIDYTILSLNHRYANGTEPLKDGDEVTIFPPVGGG